MFVLWGEDGLGRTADLSRSKRTDLERVPRHTPPAIRRDF